MPDSGALFAAVVDADDRRMLAYLCDGKNVATWFSGHTSPDGRVTPSTDNGARLSGRISGPEFTGTVVLPGETAARPVIAREVKRPAGLYRARGEVRGQPAVGGWVVLPDGRQAGAVRTSSGFIETGTDLAEPSKPVTSFTDLETDL